MSSDVKCEKNKQIALLKAFAPILHFAAGERFFPMDVNTYISNCHVKDGKGKAICQHPSAENLNNHDESHYLHFVHENGRWLHHATSTLLLILMVIIWYSVQPDQFGLLENLDARWPPLWRSWIDNWRMVLLLLPFIFLVTKRGNRTVTIALTQCLAAILFFLSPAGTAFSLIAAFFVLSSALLFMVQYWGKVHKWPSYLASTLSFITVPLIIGLAILFVQVMEQRLGFARPLIAPWFSQIYIDSYSDMLVALLLWSLIVAIIWSTISQEGNDESKSAFLLLVFTGILAIVLGILQYLDLVKHDKAIAYALIAVTSTVSIVSFFDTPLAVINRIRKAATTRQTANQNQPQYLRMFVIGFLWLFIYSQLSLYIALPFPQFIFLPEDLIILFPLLYALMIVFSIFVTIGLLGSSVAGYFMELQSSQPDSAASQAAKKYYESGASDKLHYYGRVLVDKQWAVLQYHYFYAFNDWRTIQGGLNQHEGDWECVFVFLKTRENKQNNCAMSSYDPFGIACSQHHHGEFHFWDELEPSGNQPHIYVAKGSHANFIKPNVYPSTLFVSGLTRSILNGVDSMIRLFRGQNDGLPKEDARGDGRVINNMNWKEPNLLTNDLPWVEYQGLWGHKSRHKDESGPTGPKWKRVEERRDPTIAEYRLRWHMHDWRQTLLLGMVSNDDSSLHSRIKALDTLHSDSDKP